MHSTPGPKQTDSHDVLVARVDEEFANPRRQLARDQEQVSKPERDTARYPSDPQIPVNRFRPAVLRGSVIGLLLAACIGVAAIDSQSTYGDAAKSMIAQWAPQFALTSPQLSEKPGLPAQPSPSGFQAASAEPAPSETASLSKTTSRDVAPTAALVPPVLEHLLQKIMRDLASVEQEIEQLKTSQAQMASDDARVAEQVKASQDQLARVIAKDSEQEDLRSKRSALRTRPPARKPAARTLPSPQNRSSAAVGPPNG